MAQNLITAPVTEVRKAVRIYKFHALKSWLRAIYEYKWMMNHTMNGVPEELAKEIEQKETIILVEMARRGDIDKENWKDMRKEMNAEFKRRSF